MYFHLPRSILEMHRLTSTDDNRENIQKVMVRFDESAATNGHQLVTLEHEVLELHKKDAEDLFENELNPTSEYLAEQFKDGKLDFFIPNHIAAQVLKGTKRRVHFVFRIDTEFSATIYAIDPNEHKSKIRVYSFAWATKTFPDFAQVVPKYDSPGGCYNFGLCLKLINEFYSYVKAIRAMPAGNFTVFPSVKDELSPLKTLIRTDDGMLTWVAMPCRF